MGLTSAWLRPGDKVVVLNEKIPELGGILLPFEEGDRELPVRYYHEIRFGDPENFVVDFTLLCEGRWWARVPIQSIRRFEVWAEIEDMDIFYARWARLKEHGFGPDEATWFKEGRMAVIFRKGLNDIDTKVVADILSGG